MDKNTVKAIVLAMLVMLLYPMLLKKFYPAAYQQPVKATISQREPALVKAAISPPTPEGTALGKAVIPAIAPYGNSFYKVEFSTLGGTITALSFLGEKNRQAFTKTDLFSGDPRESGIFSVSLLHEKADLAETVFKMTRKGESTEFSYELPGEYQLTKTYTFRENQPAIDLIVRIKNLSGHEKHFPITLNYGMGYEEGYQKNYGYYDAVAYADKLQTKGLSGIKKKGFSFPDPTAWAGFVKKYFALLVKPDGKIIEGNARVDEKSLWGQMTLEPLTVSGGGEGERKFLIYAGPQRYEALKSFGVDSKRSSPGDSSDFSRWGSCRF